MEIFEANSLVDTTDMTITGRIKKKEAAVSMTNIHSYYRFNLECSPLRVSRSLCSLANHT